MRVVGISTAFATLGLSAVEGFVHSNRLVGVPKIRQSYDVPAPIYEMCKTFCTVRSKTLELHVSRTTSKIDRPEQEEFLQEDPIAPAGLPSDEAVYQKGLVTIAIITLLFASNSPVLHAAYSEVSMQPPVFLLNAACSIVALLGMKIAGPLLEQTIEAPSQLNLQTASEIVNNKSSDSLLISIFGDDNYLTNKAGTELGIWKFAGCLANCYGLSLTSSDHGAFLIQLTTLFVPLAQGILGVPIPPRIWTAIGLALSGVFLFTQDGNGSTATTLQGDVACVLAAVMYATYDLRLFHYGKLVEPLQMITAKISTQTLLSMAALAAFSVGPSLDFLTQANAHDLTLVAGVALWSGLAVNALAPYMQVGGQQAVGPARAQILYASQPLWATLMSFVFLGETIGMSGIVGSGAFLSAMLLASTADVPDPNCEQDNCEV